MAWKLAVLFFLLGATSSFSASPESYLRLDSHAYSGPRGPEPRAQFIPQTLFRWKHPTAEAQVHIELETQGSHDLSLDLDRAWGEFSVFSEDALALGRQHPWDHTRYFERERPWGILANQVPQNKGVLLGYGLTPEKPSPQPILLGWVGAHYWSDRNNNDFFALGVSATPLFIPTLGSSVTLSGDSPASTTRFGRRPPGWVEINEERLPLRFEIDRSHLWQDVLLQPQVIVQGRFRPHETLETWIGYLRAPSPDPQTDSSEHLNVRADSLEVHATIRPKFPGRQMLFASQSIRTLGPHLFGTVYISDDKHWGAESGLAFSFFSASIGHDALWAPPATRFADPLAKYAEWLVQSDLCIPIGSVTPYAGWKHHLSKGDFWFYGGIRWAATRNLGLGLGADLFAGGDDTYFGEWRTNDRLSFVLRWEIGS